jgi:hypothetical protein
MNAYRNPNGTFASRPVVLASRPDPKPGRDIVNINPSAAPAGPVVLSQQPAPVKTGPTILS